MSGKVKIGQEAPNIEAETYGGEKINLTDFRDKKVVALYFYPKDNTPTCTEEACSIRDGMKDLEKHGIQVLGVSTDGVKSHENFKNKYKLNFPLLSDTAKNIVKAYGVESMFGSAKRETFLIDKSGNIRYIWNKVKADSHANEIIEKAKELGLV
jgi:thioredoxin-dependent peroxiredoxin